MFYRIFAVFVSLAVGEAQAVDLSSPLQQSKLCLPLNNSTPVIPVVDTSSGRQKTSPCADVYGGENALKQTYPSNRDYFIKTAANKNAFPLTPDSPVVRLSVRLPDLSGEWLLPCQNLGTDGLVFSRLVRLAYIGDHLVVSHSDFPGPDCNCAPPPEETNPMSSYWFEFQETKTLWKYEIKRESPFVSDAFEIDYTLVHNPFESAEFYRDLVKINNGSLYTGSFTAGLKERPSHLSEDSYIFSRHLTESVEDYMSREHSCHTESQKTQTHLE